MRTTIIKETLYLYNTHKVEYIYIDYNRKRKEVIKELETKLNAVRSRGLLIGFRLD